MTLKSIVISGEKFFSLCPFLMVNYFFHEKLFLCFELFDAIFDEKRFLSVFLKTVLYIFFAETPTN